MKNKTLSMAKIIIAIFLVVSVLFPLMRLLFNINIEDIESIVESAQFGEMVLNSLVTTSIATIIVVTLAWGFAWCVNRTRIRFKSFFSVLFTLPMLIPSISHGMGIVLLFGDNGLITNWLGINIGLYGYTGIIIGEVLYAFPVAFLMLADVFRYEDYTVYEVAGVLGLSKFQQFMTITIPNMKKTLISAIFAVFTMIFTDYGVPLVVGGKILTIPVYMYREVIGLLDFSKGALFGVILLIPAMIAFVLDLKSEKNENASTVTKLFTNSENKIRDRLAYVFCVLAIFLISAPLMTFVYLSIVKQYPIDMSLSMDSIIQAFEVGVGRYLLNSLTVALLTALIGTAVIYLTAYLTTHSNKSFSTMVLHLISMLSLAIPGIVLGLAYILFFQGSWIYGTFMMMILVNMVHFFASPYLIAYNSLSKFNEKLEDIAEVMGIGRMRILMDVYVPCTMDSMAEIFSYLFVNSMVTISAVSFLANFKIMPLALMIPQFDAQSMIEETAFISFLILIVNSIIRLGVYWVKHYIKKQSIM